MFDPVTIIQTGSPSPYPQQVPRHGCAAALRLEGNVTMIVAIDRPSVVDQIVFGSGKIEVALSSEKSVAFLIWQFSKLGRVFTLDTPLHFGLEDIGMRASLSVDGLEPTETRALHIVIQDEKHIVRGVRLIAIPRLILEHLEPLIKCQIAERNCQEVPRLYAETISLFNRRTGSPGRAFAAAEIKASVA